MIGSLKANSARLLALSQDEKKKWSLYGLGLLTGSSIQFVTYSDEVSCINDIASISEDIFFLMWIEKNKEEGEDVRLDQLPYVMNIAEKVSKWSCGLDSDTILETIDDVMDESQTADEASEITQLLMQGETTDKSLGDLFNFNDFFNSDVWFFADAALLLQEFKVQLSLSKSLWQDTNWYFSGVLLSKGIIDFGYGIWNTVQLDELAADETDEEVNDLVSDAEY